MTDQYPNDPLLEMFVFENERLLEQLESITLAAEKNDLGFSREGINEIFRIMHTIKGSAAMMSFNSISVIAHALEDVFFLVRDRQDNTLHKEVVELVIGTLDFIRMETNKVKTGTALDGDPESLLQQGRKIRKILSGEMDTPTGQPSRYRAQVRFDQDSEMENVRAFGLVHRLTEYVDEIMHEPVDLFDERATSEIRATGLTIYFSTSLPLSEIKPIFEETMFLSEFGITREEVIPQVDMDYESKLASLSQVAATVGAAMLPLEVDRKLGPKKGITAISTDKLDVLIDLVGELVISESMVTQNPDLKGLALANFFKSAGHHRKIIGDIQDLAMSLRMVPIQSVFQRMQRVLRDACQQSGKEATLEMLGEGTEIDKNIVETLSDPLMHLVRNAVDHGLEDLTSRRDLGKPTSGKVTLEAKNVAGEVIITITDDGYGLNREKILKKAISQNLVPLGTRGEDMPDQDIYALLFTPGFSTRESTTELSGRGVGLDVVKRNLEKIRGSVSIESREGTGTRFSLRIPLTLAIISGMLISVGEARYTIPITDIVECFRPQASQIIRDLDDNEIIMVRGNAVPVQRLHKLYNIKTERTDLESGILILVDKGGSLSCVFADSLLGERQVVVKPLPAYVRKVKGVAACTLLGDGSISLILDIDGLRELGGLATERRW